MIVKISKISLCIRIQAFIQQPGDHLSLDFQGTGGNIHHLIQTSVKIFFISGQIGNTGHINSNHAHASGALAGAEVSACFLSQLTQIQAEAAAHGAHVAGLHVGIDIITEIRGAVFSSHFKKEPVVFRIGPVKIPGDGVGGNRILEASAVGVAFDHDFDESLVHHIHLRLAVLVFEIHFFAAHDGRQLRQVIRHGPVQRDVGEGRLRSPAAGGIDPVNKGFNAFLHFRIGQVVSLHKRGKVGIKGRKSLRTRPFVLHDSQEVNHLVAEHGKMCRRSRSDFPGDSAQALGDQLL